MSKVSAYQCDYCDEIVIEQKCLGISAQIDIDPLESNKTCKPELSDVHICTGCIATNITDPVDGMNRKSNSDEEKRSRRLKELAYSTKQYIFNRLKKRAHEKSLKKRS